MTRYSKTGPCLPEMEMKPLKKQTHEPPLFPPGSPKKHNTSPVFQHIKAIGDEYLEDYYQHTQTSFRLFSPKRFSRISITIASHFREIDTLKRREHLLHLLCNRIPDATDESETGKLLVTQARKHLPLNSRLQKIISKSDLSENSVNTSDEINKASDYITLQKPHSYLAMSKNAANIYLHRCLLNDNIDRKHQMDARMLLRPECLTYEEALDLIRQIKNHYLFSKPVTPDAFSELDFNRMDIEQKATLTFLVKYYTLGIGQLNNILFDQLNWAERELKQWTETHSPSPRYIKVCPTLYGGSSDHIILQNITSWINNHVLTKRPKTAAKQSPFVSSTITTPCTNNKPNHSILENNQLPSTSSDIYAL